LGKNEISDVEPLASLAKLTLLDLHGNPINNCQALPKNFVTPANKSVIA
jgi:Leucine-rich repeat (LRR) protein